MSEKVPCPFCASKDAVAVRSKADIVCCNACQLVYLRTRPTVAELEQHYQTYASNPGSHMKLPASPQEIKSSGLRRQSFLNEVVEFTGSDRRRLLDNGCGWGAFLDNARDHQFTPCGVEICRQMADFANNTLRIPVFSKQLEECHFEPSSLQVVTMLHSFEHLPNQRRALNFIHGILEPDGFLCGIVPNFASFCSDVMRDAWPWLDPSMHAVQFTPDTIAKAFWSCGFNMLRLYTATGDFDTKIVEQQIKNTGSRITAGQLNEIGQGEEIRFFAQRI